MTGMRREAAIRVVGVGGRRNVLIPLTFFRFKPLAESYRLMLAKGQPRQASCNQPILVRSGFGAGVAAIFSRHIYGREQSGRELLAL